MSANIRKRTDRLPAGIDTGETSVVDRLRRGLAEAGLDCRCKEEADRLFDKAEQIRRTGALEEAARMRDAIAIVMVLLGELDDLAANEGDLTAFEEIACLFEDIADYAHRGAAFGRLLAGGSGGQSRETVQ